MKPKFNKRSLIIVEWEDTCTIASWDSDDKAKNDSPLQSQSVGWRLPSPKNVVVLTAMRNEGGNCTGRQIIPRGCIKSIRRLE